MKISARNVSYRCMQDVEEKETSRQTATAAATKGLENVNKIHNREGITFHI